jgi:selenocysteine lyase/cysteine desulfurase
MANWLDDATRQGAAHWMRWSDRVEEVRELAAKLASASSTELAFVSNTTHGIGLVAEAFPWNEGDEVVTLGDEFPSNLYPWVNLASRGVAARVVQPVAGQPIIDQLRSAISDRTRLVAVSWVDYARGRRLDLAALCEMVHGEGALLFLDAIQGLGALSFDLRQTPVDFFAADGHKWMLGPEGLGLLYVKQEHLDLLRPILVGWNSVVHAGQFDNKSMALRDSARRFEGGSWNMAGVVGLGASLEMLLEAGIGPIEGRILELTDMACERLAGLGCAIASDRSPNVRSGIVSFEVPGRDPMELRRAAKSLGVVMSCRGGRLRISPHAYNNHQDLDRLIEAVAANLKGASAG